MKKNKKILLLIVFLILLIPTYNLSAESESSLKRDIANKTEKLNSLYEEVERINEDIDKNKEKSNSIESQREEIEEELDNNKELLTNILLFLQYYSANDLWMIVLSSDNILTNLYLLDNIFTRFSNDLEETIKKINDLDELQTNYEESLRELETKKEELEKQVSEYEKAYEELQVKLQELQKEESFDLTTNSNAAISQSSQNTLMAQAGISSSNYQYVDYIVSIESSWNYTAVNPYSGAYGLCQALPPSKMAQFGSDWKDNPVTQLKFCNSYANNRYGSWENAANFIKSNGWW